MPSSPDAGTDPHEEHAPQSAIEGPLRRGKWVVVLTGAFCLLLIIVPFKLLLDQQALHRKSLDYVTSKDRGMLYWMNIEYVTVMNALLRAAAQGDTADLSMVRTAIEELSERSGVLRNARQPQTVLTELPEFKEAAVAMSAAIDSAAPILAAERGPHISPAEIHQLIDIFEKLDPTLDRMTRAAVSANAAQQDMLANGFNHSVLRVAIAAALLSATGIVFIIWLVRTKRVARRAEHRVQSLTLQLQRSEARLRGFMQNAPVIMSVKDLEGRYLMVNPRSEQHFGLAAKDIIGRHTLDLASTPGHQAMVALEQDVIATNRTQVQQIQYGYEPDCQWYIAVKFPIHDAAGRVTAVGGIGLNITERKQTEALLVQAQKMEAIGNLTGGVAHDFNNYLAVIMGNLDMLKEDLTGNAAAQKLVDGALNGALKGAELTQRLLAFSRRQPLDPKPTDVNERIAGILPLIEHSLREDISIELETAPHVWRTLIDGVQLDTCIINLTNNARDAMPTGGRLRISTRNVRFKAAGPEEHADIPSGDYVVIEIADTGTGMTADVQSKMFEPFFTTKGIAHGTGLGLSMVYGFVKQSQGHIRIHSEISRGTAVTIHLPRVSASELRAQPTHPKAGATAPTGTEVILLVEDNAILRDTVAAQLALLGYQVIPACNGDAALPVLDAEERQLDLLFTDVVMPGTLDGIALADKARQRRPGLKVLLTSGFPGDTADRQRESAMTYDLLVKPYRMDELARAVRTTLGEKQSADALHER